MSVYAASGVLDDLGPLPSGRPAIEAAGLTKTYGSGDKAVRALAGISFAVPAGSVFGLLGPNGAGKSTTVKILTTLSRARRRHGSVAGIDVHRSPARVRRAIGYVSQKPGFDPMATGRENLVLAGRIHGLSAARPGRGPTSCSTASVSPRRPTGWPATGPAACSASSTSPSAWCTGRRCCSSTSRPPDSTREARAEMWAEIAPAGRARTG